MKRTVSEHFTEWLFPTGVRVMVTHEFLTDPAARRYIARRLRAARCPRPCPACGLLKDGTGLLCAYCHRAARIQLQEDNQL